MELLHHGLRIRPVGPVELPVALDCPVEEVDDNLINFNPCLLIGPCDLQHLLLGPIAELALPKPHPILREHRRPPGHAGVVLQDLLRRICCGDPVVHLPGGGSGPLGDRLAKHHAADGRVIPQHAVSKARDEERHGDLGISLDELQLTPLQVHVLLLVLAHAEDLLAVISLKADLEGVFGPADDPLPGAALDLEASRLPGDRPVIAAEVLPQDLLSLLIKRDHARIVYRSRKISVCDSRLGAGPHAAPRGLLLIASDFDSCRRPVRFLRQRPVRVLDLQKLCSPDPEGILPPALDPQRLPVPFCLQHPIPVEKLHRILLFQVFARHPLLFSVLVLYCFHL